MTLQSSKTSVAAVCSLLQAVVTETYIGDSYSEKQAPDQQKAPPQDSSKKDVLLGSFMRLFVPKEAHGGRDIEMEIS